MDTNHLLFEKESRKGEEAVGGWIWSTKCFYSMWPENHRLLRSHDWRPALDQTIPTIYSNTTSRFKKTCQKTHFIIMKGVCPHDIHFWWFLTSRRSLIGWDIQSQTVDQVVIGWEVCFRRYQEPGPWQFSSMFRKELAVVYFANSGRNPWSEMIQ